MSSTAVELAAPWCFNIDARKQDQDTGTTSSIAFKHVRLFLKNRFGDPGDDVKALEESQKREGCSMATSTSEFVLRFGADDNRPINSRRAAPFTAAHREIIIPI